MSNTNSNTPQYNGMTYSNFNNMCYDEVTYTHTEALDALEQLAADTDRNRDFDALMNCNLNPVRHAFYLLMTWTEDTGMSLEDYVIPRV